MGLTWQPERPTPPIRIHRRGMVRAIVRGGPLTVLLGGGLVAILSLRQVERLFWGPRRPWTPWITVAVCRATLRLVGLEVIQEARPIQQSGSIVANHSSWLDIFVLNAAGPVVFVSKAEVAGWPGIGVLARATGTLFIRRDAPREAADQVAAIRDRIARGEVVVLFPEGTSSDGRRVLPFKTALLAAVPSGSAVQPVTLSWRAPEGEDPCFYGWFGSMSFSRHLLSVLGARRRGRVIITWHAPIPTLGVSRKVLARTAEDAIRGSLR